MIGGYVRVSTESQRDSGLSVEAQRQGIRAAAGDDVVLYEDLGVSGERADRPGLARLLDDARAGRA